MADLIRSLRIPLILVCSERVGTINQTLLSVHLANSRKLNLLGIVVNPGKTKSGGPDILQNARILRENCDLPVIGLPRQSEAGKEEAFWRALLGRDG